MPLYVMSYDLNKGKDYKKLYDELERLGGHRALDSLFLLNVTSSTADVLRDHLKKFVDGDDSLFVAKLTERPATLRTNSGTKEWLDKNFGTLT